MNHVEEAAEQVIAALRALSALRHVSAPTLERDYQRALESYFDLAERAMGRNPDRDEASDSAILKAETIDEAEEIDPRAEEGQHAHAAIAAHYAAARHAVRLVRRYRSEAGTSGRREREALEAVSRHRDTVRRLRLRMRNTGEQLALPGLAKARPGIAAPLQIAASGAKR